MRRLAALSTLSFLVACTTSTKSAPPPSALWEAELTLPTTPRDETALALDFPRRRALGLGGKLTTWMRWLDVRSPGASIESLPNAGTPQAIVVTARLDDDTEVPCALDFSQPRSTVKSTAVRLGETKLGPLEPSGEGACVLGLDVLSKTVLVVPRYGKQPVWLMVPTE